MPASEDIYPSSVEHMKCKFIIFKYVWDNWNNIHLVEGKNKEISKESFCEHLEDLFEDLVALKLLLPMFNPIVIQETIVKRLKKNSGVPLDCHLFSVAIVYGGVIS
ncbi:hypothetical protein INT47_006650 [Mucor saturninus]|uniref:Uncharacterized protein n=1 Tax=Mucor saturninus TaxID=64648 RepID=A0A8H7QDD7_9FUNG|nr:hypothetical protein INT47_006650 [Mucor saturninus]